MITESREKSEDVQIDATLRPQSFDDYVGQEQVKRNLRVTIDAAKKRGDPLEHILLYGPAGLGKTTLAHIIAREIGKNIRVTSGPAFERVGDLGSILTNLEDGDILFVDEIHRLNKTIEEILYPAMEDGKLDIIIGKGPSARTLQLDLPKFTLIGATTRLGSLSNPLRDRFGVVHRLDFYSHKETEKIIHRASRILGITLEKDAAGHIARCSRQTPRVANRLLKRVRDFAQVRDCSRVTADIVEETMQMLDIDSIGLEPTDRSILNSIIVKFGGGPVGVSTIAAATSEEVQTIEDVYEPYLIKIGFLERTPRGRMVTEHCLRHLGHSVSGERQRRII